jgi:hypothetical protein
MKEFIKIIVVVWIASVWNMAHAEKIDDKNVKQFLNEFTYSYLHQEMKLIKGFSKYKEGNNYQGFVEFKNKQWNPDYEKERKHYNAVMNENSHYFFKNNLTSIISNYTNLFTYANDLFFDLRSTDHTKRNQVVEFLKRDTLFLEKELKERGLDINEVAKLLP